MLLLHVEGGEKGGGEEGEEVGEGDVKTEIPRTVPGNEGGQLVVDFDVLGEFDGSEGTPQDG